ncbi:MAG: FISUMP domain-containing protein [Bacteroidota bacterium]|nr:FISUMP domain-containing protein [Bacteroidota bacterium]
MKKLQLLSLFLLACVLTLNAQEISFTFTSNHTCEYAPLDSVLVENLTQSGDTVLYWDDTVLNIVFTSAEMPAAMDNDFHVSQNYPNPFSSKTKIDVFVPEQDDFTINVYDVTGRQITSYENSLEKGMHNFTFNAGNSSNYILTVNSTKYVQKKLMIRVGADDNPAANLTYNGIIPEKKSMLKSGKSNFAYEIGDNLEFSGYVDGDFTSITDAPTTDNDYLFDINNTAPDAPGAITGNTAVCEEATSETYSISAVAGATSYTWTVPAGASITSGAGTTSINVDFGLSSGDVCVTASNACGESVPACKTVLMSNVSVDLPEEMNVCHGQNVTLTAAGINGIPPYQYEWSDNLSTTTAELTVNPTEDTTYTVIVTDSVGCTAENSVDLLVHPAISAEIESDADTICEGECFAVIAHASGGTPPYSYTWMPEGYDSTLNFCPYSPGDIAVSVTVTDSWGCYVCESTTIIVDTAPSINAESNAPVCEGEDIDLTETGGDAVSWTWSGPNSFSSNNQNPTITSASTADAGDYFVTVTDANGCTGTASTNVIVNDSITATASADPNVICDGENTTLTGEATGGQPPYNYTWNNGLGYGQIQTVFPAITTTYTVTITDANGCSATDTVMVTVNPNPTVSTTSNSPVCEGEDINLMETGGEGIYWGWNGPNMFTSTNHNPTITSASTANAGDYFVTVTDANGCTNVDNVSVTVNSTPAAPTAGTHVPGEDTIVWNWTTVADATGYMYNTSDDYATATDNGIDTTYTQTSLDCETAYTLYVWAYNDCGESSSTTLNETTSDCPSITICGEETQIVDVTSNGEIWMDRNLGASQQATSSTDYNAYGALFQWGRLSDGHECINWTSSTGSDGAEQSNETSTPSPTDDPGHSDFILSDGSPYDWRDPQNDNLWQGVSGTNNPCPSGYRLPTETELQNEMDSWDSEDATGAYDSPLKLTVAGRRQFTAGLLGNVGIYGRYWSSTVISTSVKGISFNSSSAVMDSHGRAGGISVRCIKD